MHPEFQTFVDSLEPKFRQLIEMTPVMYGALPKDLPKRAIYLFSDGDAHQYVGRTNNLRRRLRGHCIPSATHLTASFAFRMAREKAGFPKATYKALGSRAALAGDPTFGPAFIAAKQRAARMRLRYVEEADPVRQALLEIYVATVLKTPFNDFDNH